MNQKLKPSTGTLVFFIIVGLIFLFVGISMKHIEAAIICYLATLLFWLIAYPAAMSRSKKKFKMQEALRIKAEEINQRRLAREAEKARVQKEYDDKVSEFKSKYGEISKTITFGLSSDFEDNVIFFNDAQVAIINGHDIPFNKILSFQYSAEKKIIKGKTTYRTETDNSNMFNRAGLGYLINGKIGAGIGAQTAAKNTIVHQEADKIYYTYEINVTIDSLENPIQRLKLGSYKHQAEELHSMLTVIINRNTPK